MAEGKDKFDINNDQKLKQDNLDKSDGPIAKTEILDGQPEHGNQSHVSEPTADGVIWGGNDDWDQPGLVGDGSIAKTEILDGQPEHGMAGGDAENYNAGTNWVKTDTPIHDTEERADADIIPGDHIAKTEILDGQPEQGILGQANGAPNVSGEVVNMADMHSHMDDATTHQVPEGPPQDPQGMGLDRLGTQFDEDGMGDMHTPDDPNDGGEVV